MALSPRRRARAVALQALYAWRLAGGDPLEQARALEGWAQCDQPFAEELIRGVVERGEALEAQFEPFLDRSLARLSPVERTVLGIGAYELAYRAETPARVVLNEAIELGKTFGAAEGYKYVNGVLEKLAAALRPGELVRA